MHGVVLNIQPDTRIIDLCHSIASYDIFDGAWTIAQSYQFFPPGTVHVVVIDPGVGSEIVLLQPAASDPWTLQEAWVSADGLNVRAVVDVGASRAT